MIGVDLDDPDLCGWYAELKCAPLKAGKLEDALVVLLQDRRAVHATGSLPSVAHVVRAGLTDQVSKKRQLKK
jgi:hypothetical protein